ncbi:hypothetical protein LV779_09610 [Streptomyces thinghirensis]|nr:hypothetical protein [Streptomyces thinghirensis]
MPLTDDSTAGAHAFAFLRHLFEELEPWTAGRFLNFMGHGATADRERTRTAYAPDDYKRLDRSEGGVRPTEHLPPQLQHRAG